MPENDNDRRLYEVMQTTTKMAGQLEGVTNLIQMMNKRLDKLDNISQTAAVQTAQLTQLENEHEQLRADVETLKRDSLDGDSRLAVRIEKLEKADGASALDNVKSLKKAVVGTIIGIMIPTLLANIGTIVQLFVKK